ncbi:sperm acrosome-associated protein 9 [Denticeps clupeoides]|uniref:Uncharacterized protein n=1 Tax=Denticeps clupeoides TaxID=299321 RepID=A0AAY4EKL3_9TELE|nr:sperm acrosome-associated protein 9 [Denticeps clupeoides]
MNEVSKALAAIEEKHERFKQQQFIFISALERSRDLTFERTQPVSSVQQVQKYINLHCHNATDRRIFSLFLEIVEDLGNVTALLQSFKTEQRPACDSLETCKILLGPYHDISNLRARYPHNELNRLSCNEARNYYGGVVSLIPSALDLLKTASAAMRTAVETQTIEITKDEIVEQNTSFYRTGSSSSNKTKNASCKTSKPVAKGIGGWHAGKPAWK